MSSSLDDFDFSAGFGGGSGAEERGTSHKLPDGYAWMIHQPEAMTALFHFINTRAPPSLPQDQLEEGETSKLLECPCTPRGSSMSPTCQWMASAPSHHSAPAMPSSCKTTPPARYPPTGADGAAARMESSSLIRTRSTPLTCQRTRFTASSFSLTLTG